MVIKDRLNLILREKNITKADLARKIEISKGNISSYFSGQLEPGKKFLLQLQKIYDINPSWVMTGEGSMTIEPTEEERKEAHQIADDWQAKLNLTDQELSLLIDKLATDKEMFILMAKSLSGDTTALERLKKLIC